MYSESRVSLEKHRDFGYSLALIDYDSPTIYLGNEVRPDDVEECIEDALTHEYIHYALFKLFNVRIAKTYDTIYEEAEPNGRVTTIATHETE